VKLHTLHTFQLRRAAATAALVATALLPAVGTLMQLSRPEAWRPHEDDLSRFERRLAPLRAALSGVAVVGYVDPTGRDGTPAAIARLYMTRYVLAPVQVIQGVDQDLVVAIGTLEPNLLSRRFRVRQDFGGGLLLLERSAEGRP